MTELRKRTFFSRMSFQRGSIFPGIAIAVCLLAGASALSAEPLRWVSDMVPEAEGRIVILPDGKKTQLRYPKWDDTDFSAYRTHGYSDPTKSLQISKAELPRHITGEPSKGKAIWDKSPCINCHAVPSKNAESWAGSMGPSLFGYGNRKVDPAHTFQMIYDPRVFFPSSIMPPWGASGLLSKEEIVHVVAYLNTLKADTAETITPTQNPEIRKVPPRYFGDNLDPTINPAALYAETASDLWHAAGPKQKSCQTCHSGSIANAMNGVALRFPKYAKSYQRVVSLEDFLSVHAPATTGKNMPIGGNDNLNLTMLIKMASNGQTINIDLDDPDNKQAWGRGKETFYKRVGQRNHACADCHSAERVNGKWLGGKYISRADVKAGLTSSYPAWRTSFGESWSIRKRMQWCLLPHGANYLPADAQEYADLELYMTSFENGKKMNVPGLKD